MFKKIHLNRLLRLLLCVFVCVFVFQHTQRIHSSQSNQPLATPVVSVTTPSLPPQGLIYSGMPTSYNPAGESFSHSLPQLPLWGMLVGHAADCSMFLSDSQCSM